MQLNRLALVFTMAATRLWTVAADYSDSCGPRAGNGKCCKLGATAAPWVFMVCDCRNTAGGWGAAPLEFNKCFSNSNGNLWLTPKYVAHFSVVPE